jgi:hypothetical protein
MADAKVNRCRKRRRPMPRHPDWEIGSTCLEKLLAEAGIRQPTRLPSPSVRVPAAPVDEEHPDQMALLDRGECSV